MPDTDRTRGGHRLGKRGIFWLVILICFCLSPLVYIAVQLATNTRPGGYLQDVPLPRLVAIGNNTGISSERDIKLSAEDFKLSVYDAWSITNDTDGVVALPLCYTLYVPSYYEDDYVESPFLKAELDGIAVGADRSFIRSGAWTSEAAVVGDILSGTYTGLIGEDCVKEEYCATCYQLEISIPAGGTALLELSYNYNGVDTVFIAAEHEGAVPCDSFALDISCSGRWARIGVNDLGLRKRQTAAVIEADPERGYYLCLNKFGEEPSEG